MSRHNSLFLYMSLVCFLAVIFSCCWFTASSSLDLRTWLLWDLLCNCTSSTLDMHMRNQLSCWFFFQCCVPEMPLVKRFDAALVLWSSLSSVCVSVEPTPSRTFPLFLFGASVQCPCLSALINNLLWGSDYTENRLQRSWENTRTMRGFF